MTPGGNNFNDFPEIVPTGEHTHTHTHTRLTAPCPGLPGQGAVSLVVLSFFSSVAVGIFLEWAQCCSINRTILNTAQHINGSLQEALRLQTADGPRDALRQSKSFQL